MTKLKRFAQFINEARHWSEDPWLAKKVAQVFNQIPSIEEDVVDKIDAVEEEWKHIKESFWWNRESGGFNKDHFALDVKVHVYPDNDKLREATGLTEDELTDEEIDDMWWQWFNDQREFFEEDIEELYNWIGLVGWGGKSGGWLLLSPEYTGDDVITDIEDKVIEYEESISELKDSPEEGEWERIKSLLNSEDYTDLKRMGLAEMPEEAESLVEKIAEIKNLCDKTIADFKQWFTDMTEIQNRVSEFEDKAADQFHEWAVEEIKDRSL